MNSEKFMPEACALLQKLLEVFEKECCIPCSRCHELRDEIAELLACVPKNAENETQNSLCRTNETQRRSVWHPVTEVPDFIDAWARIVYINDAMFIESFRFYRADNWQATVNERHIRKWAYGGELEAL